MPSLVPGIPLSGAQSCFPCRNGRDKCLARRHPRRVFGDMTDASSLHGFGCKEGHPCHGARCRLWTNEVSLFDLRCSRGPTGGSYVGGSAFTRTRVTSGSADGLAVRRVWPIARAGLTQALSVAAALEARILAVR